MKFKIRLFLASIFSLYFHFFSYAQYVSISPSFPSLDEEVTITFDASQGNKELVGATKVYMHHGVVVDKVDGEAWTRVKGNWGKDDGVGLMSKIAGTDKWTLKISPSIRQYFGSPASETIYRISGVFRNADGSKKGTIAPGTFAWGTVAANQDVYINISKDASLVIEGTASNEVFLAPGQKLTIKGVASTTASTMKVFIDEGFGFFEQKSQSNTKEIAYDFAPSKSQFIRAKVEATIGSQTVKAEREYNIVIKSSPVIAALPQGLKPGINYSNDATKVTLVIEAPKKEFLYVVGDFNNWQVNDLYLMNVTPDKQTFWLEIKNLTPIKKYGFQYWIDGKTKIGDPYSELIADPWNDKFIEPNVYPDPYLYTKTEYGLATILQTGKPNYNWSATEANWKKPKADNLVIYELHLRDFLADHSYKSLIDTLSYIQRLGVNAIELMPLGEFEGNDSWGYNPSYHMALDKYYGTKEDLKKLVDACHSNGLAIILDIVFNHAYGQNPLLMMYFDGSLPEANNPYFNRDYVGPFQWGYDFNHESVYTQRYMDQINAYWLKEYHIDGFRFDFTKGFTNKAPNNSLDAYDGSRIAILKRMISKMQEVVEDPIIILEHFGQAAEESELAQTGAKMWSNRSYDYVPAANGNAGSGSFISVNSLNHVSYFNSHDEQRIQYHMKKEGLSAESYQIQQDPIWYERQKLIAAFNYLLPGPKMIWQFDELGYDIGIDENGRVGKKPHPWSGGPLNYYANPMRQNIYAGYKEILNLRSSYGTDKMTTSSTNHLLNGDVRKLVYDHNEEDMIVIGNFSINPKTHNPQFTQLGKWYDYTTGAEINITDLNHQISLAPGELKIFTTKKMSDGFPSVFNSFINPVTILPPVFKKNDLITLRFDATKASKNGTAGLVGASKVYFHSGAITDPGSYNWNITKGSFTDDGVGLMTKVSGDIWEIKITPQDYFALSSTTDLFKIGMYFRDASNINQGKGFMNTDIYFDVASGENILTIDPPQFNADSDVTITFNAGEGNKELVGIDKIYMHSSVSVVDSENPAATSWNRVIGNWGKDDGIGLMTKVPNTNLYTIKLRPSAYYKLSSGEYPFWLAAVFRNADGSKKGTTRVGALPNGFVAPNLDFFIRNKTTTSTTNELQNVTVYPNPAHSNLFIEGVEGEFNFSLFTINGAEVYNTRSLQKEVTLPNQLQGLFYYMIESENKRKVDKVLILK